MMTHEEIEAAIERLEKHSKEDHSVHAVLCRLMDSRGWLTSELRGTFISLLRQADPDTHMELPKDADGEYIHIGDELVSNHSKKKIVVTRLQYSREHAWMVGGADKDDLSEYGLYAPCETRHYHKPTVEDVLREFVNEWVEADSEGDIFAEYAAKIREVME